MLRTTAYALVCSLAFLGIQGCTLHINSGPNQPNQPNTNPTNANTTPPKPGVPGRGKGLVISRRGAVAKVQPPKGQGMGQGAPKHPTPVAPKITSQIAFGNGTDGAFMGQAYVIEPGTKKLPNLDQLVPFATLYTDSFQVSSQDFSSGFPGALKQDDWFAIRYDGTITVPADGQYTFELVSDDGAILYIDGHKVVDNDGVHEATTKSAKRQLKTGNHTLRLEYFQAEQGKVALTLSVIVEDKKAPLIGLRPTS